MALLISVVTVGVGQFVPQVGAWAQLGARGVDFPSLVFHGLLGLLPFAASLHVHHGRHGADGRQPWPQAPHARRDA